MRKSIFPLILLLFLSVKFSFAQWQPDVLLSNIGSNSYTAFNSAWCVASVGNIVHAVWTGGPGYNQVRYRRSTDAGMTWSAETVLSTDTWYFTGYPSIAASDSLVYIMWVYNHNASNELFSKRSTDAGLTWSPRFQFSSTSQSYQTSISVSGFNIYTVWPEFYGTRYISNRNSHDGGLSFGYVSSLTNDTVNPTNPSIASLNASVHAVWYDLLQQLFYDRSTDGGNSWTGKIQLTTSPTIYNPCIALSGSLINIVWYDNRDGNYEIYCKHSSDAGISWGPDSRLTNAPDNSQDPSIAMSGQNVHVVWQDHRDGNWEIYYKNSSDGGLNWGPDTRLSFDTAVSEFPSVSVSGSAVHVVWTDFRNGYAEVFYKLNPSGNVLGINPVSTNIPAIFSLFQNYPNPFNPSTKIKFDIPANVNSQTSNVKLVVYDALGREVSTLVNEVLKAGSYEVVWNASNYPSGVYFYKLTSGEFSQTRKLVLIK